MSAAHDIATIPRIVLQNVAPLPCAAYSLDIQRGLTGADIRARIYLGY
jgi:hypothetical protein